MKPVSNILSNLINDQQQTVNLAQENLNNHAGNEPTNQQQAHPSYGVDPSFKEKKEQAEWLWLEMDSLFPNKWFNSVGEAVFILRDEKGNEFEQLSPIARRWIKKLSVFKGADIAQGLDYLSDQPFKYLPNLSDVVSFCEEAKRKRLSDESYQAQQQRIKDKRLLEKKPPTLEQKMSALNAQLDTFKVLGMFDAVKDIEAELALLANG